VWGVFWLRYLYCFWVEGTQFSPRIAYAESTFHGWLVLFLCNDNNTTLSAMQLFALLLPALAAAGLLGSNADAGDESPRLASVSTSGAPVATLGAALEVLE
jgi:hypothetical protein